MYRARTYYEVSNLNDLRAIVKDTEFWPGEYPIMVISGYGLTTTSITINES